MSFLAQGRLSDSPYVECVWRGQSDLDTTLMCPADGRWNLRVARLNGKVHVSIEGPLTRAVPKTHVEGIDWMVIKFKLGVFVPRVSDRKLLDGEVLLPEAARRSFWLHGSTWKLPDYENADTFVNRLIRQEVLLWDSVVHAVLQGHPHGVSSRTVRHRFLQAIGLPYGTVQQIERARDAATLLEQGVPILDVVDQLGYADQPHLTRSLKRFMGYTPTQIVSSRKLQLQ